MLVRTTW